MTEHGCTKEIAASVQAGVIDVFHADSLAGPMKNLASKGDCRCGVVQAAEPTRGSPFWRPPAIINGAVPAELRQVLRNLAPGKDWLLHFPVPLLFDLRLPIRNGECAIAQYALTSKNSPSILAAAKMEVPIN